MENTKKSTPRHIMRLPEVIAVSGLGRSSIYEYMARGEFPTHRRIGRRAVGWDSLKVFAWVNARMGGPLAAHLRKTLEDERRAENLIIQIACESDFRCESLSAEDLTRLDLAQKRIASIDRQLAELDGPDWGGQ